MLTERVPLTTCALVRMRSGPIANPLPSWIPPQPGASMRTVAEAATRTPGVSSAFGSGSVSVGRRGSMPTNTCGKTWAESCSCNVASASGGRGTRSSIWRRIAEPWICRATSALGP